MKKITKNNKGFSLIELIIVIAIMAVLVAIIAPNLTKYLGKSKASTDKKNLDEILTQVQTCISDYESSDDSSGNPHGYVLSSGTLTVEWDNTGLKSTGITDFDDLIKSAITSSTKSKEVTSGTGEYAKVTVTLKDSSDPSKGYKLLGELGKLTGDPSTGGKGIVR